MDIQTVKIASWRDLHVWQKAHQATLEIYNLTKSFPSEERFRLTDQICRSAASVPTNIAEGKGRLSTSEFKQFLVIARGSIEETRYLLLLAKDLGYVTAPVHQNLEATYTEISKMTNGLIKSLACPRS